MFESGWEALTDGRQWSGVTPTFLAGFSRCPGVARRPSRISESGREALPDVREW